MPTVGSILSILGVISEDYSVLKQEVTVSSTKMHMPSYPPPSGWSALNNTIFSADHPGKEHSESGIIGLSEDSAIKMSCSLRSATIQVISGSLDIRKLTFLYKTDHCVYSVFSFWLCSNNSENSLQVFDCQLRSQRLVRLSKFPSMFPAVGFTQGLCHLEPPYDCRQKNAATSCFAESSSEVKRYWRLP